MKTRIRAVLLFLTIVALFGAGARVQSAQSFEDEPKYRVRLAADDLAMVREGLERAGYDVLGTNPEAGSVEVAVSDAGLLALQRSSWTIVAIERARPLRSAAGGRLQAGASLDVTLEAAATTGYPDLNAILARMNQIAAAYPDIAQLVDITATYNTPATFEGRHLYALKISDNVSVAEDEPSMLIVGTHHAREIVPPLIALNAADHLTAGYGVDPRITTAVDTHEIWIAPVWNPDGYNYVFTTNNMWRKNRRVFSNGVGVDQNRNYQQGWSSSCAGSTNVSSDTYKGPSAASEAETRTLMAWAEAERFAKVIDYHSSGREVLYGYRCLSHPFTSWMRQEATTLSLASGYGGHTRLPSAEGEHQQWHFARLGSYAFLIETHTEFQPSYASGLAEAELVWPGVLTALERPVSLFGHVTDQTGAPLSANVELLNVNFTNGETNGSGARFGRYNMFVPAGTYDVRFSHDGYAPVVHRVVVGASTATALDVQLAPETVVYADDFESDSGWSRNPNGTDTATAGLWERGDPQSTSSNGLKQLGNTVSGVNDLVTGRLSGSSSGEHDVDGGRTSIQSPPIALPSAPALTMTFSYYFAHGSNSSSADYLRVTVVGSSTQAVVFQELGAANNDNAAWATATVNLSAFAGQTVRILIEAADLSGASLVEAAIDDVKIVTAGPGL